MKTISSGTTIPDQADVIERGECRVADPWQHLSHLCSLQGLRLFEVVQRPDTGRGADGIGGGPRVGRLPDLLLLDAVTAGRFEDSAAAAAI